MKYNVLVIAGTTESRQVIERLLGENPKERILASVATELGKEMLPIIDALADFGNYYKSIID